MTSTKLNMLLMTLILLRGLQYTAQQTCDTQLCPESYRGDGICDVYCMTAACGFDGLETGTSDCENECLAHGCYKPLGQESTTCNEACNAPECGFDSGTCGWCASGCFTTLSGDHDCQEVCDTLLCGFDQGDCVHVTQGNCASGCFTSMLGDEHCDSACLNSECDFDRGDCISEACAPGCYPKMIDDGECQQQCWVPECNYDGVDCACSPGCNAIVDDSHICNPLCDNKACAFDGGDCVFLT